MRSIYIFAGIIILAAGACGTQELFKKLHAKKIKTGAGKSEDHG